MSRTGGYRRSVYALRNSKSLVNRSRVACVSGCLFMAILCRPTIQHTSRDKLKQAGCQLVRESHCHGFNLWKNAAMNHFVQRLNQDGRDFRQNGVMNENRYPACILCNVCTFGALNSGRLAVVKMTFIAPVSAAGDRRKTGVSFCVTHYTNEVELSAMLVPDEKTSAKSIWCITYTTEGKISGRIGGMKVVARGRCPCRHRRTWGCLRQRESCAESALDGPRNPIGALVGSVGIFHFVPLGHL